MCVCVCVYVCVCVCVCVSKCLSYIRIFTTVGLRGAVAFALVLTLEGWEESTLTMLTTTTLIIVLFTILLLGGSTLPLLKVRCA